MGALVVRQCMAPRYNEGCVGGTGDGGREGRRKDVRVITITTRRSHKPRHPASLSLCSRVFGP